MDRIENVAKAVYIGVVIATFLLNSRRIHKAIELLKECLFVVRNMHKAMGKENAFVRYMYLNVYKTMFRAYDLISDHTSAIESGRKILVLLRESDESYQEGRLSYRLGQLCKQQSKYEKANEFYMNALRIATETRDKELEGACYANLGTVFKYVGKFNKAEEYLQKALKIAIEIGDERSIAANYGNLGTLFRSLGKYDKAKGYLQKALKIQIKIGEKHGEASNYGNLGNVFTSLGNHDKAEEYLQKALKIKIEIGDRKGEAACYGNLGSVFLSAGKYDKAEEYLQKALKILIKIGDKLSEGSIYGNLGSVYQHRGKYDKAEEYLQKALKIQIEFGDKQGEAISYGNLGTVFRCRGKCDKAEEHHQKALEIFVEIGDKEGEASAYLKLGAVFESLSKYDMAEGYLQRALKISIELGNKQGEATAYTNLGGVFQSIGKYDTADEYLQKALKISIEIGYKQGEARAYGNLANVFQSLSKYDKAEDYLYKALQIQIGIGDKEFEATIYESLGAVFLSVGKFDKAQEYLQKSLEIQIEIGNKKGEASAWGALGAVFRSLDKYDKAEECLKKGLKIQIEIGDKQGEASAYGFLGIIYMSLNTYDKAEEYLQKALQIRIEIGYERGEASDYGNLGSLYFRIGEYSKAKEYHEKALSLAYKIGYIEVQFANHLNFTLLTLILTGDIDEAVSCLIKSIEKSVEMQIFLKDNDDFKICSLDKYISPYKMLITLFSDFGKFNEALYVAELARARALADMMSAQYSVEQEISVNPQSWVGIDRIMRKEIDSACLYVTYSHGDLFLWIIKGNKPILFRKKNINDCFSVNGARNVNELFDDISLRNFPPLPTQKHCEDRSLPQSDAGILTFSRPVEEDEDNDQYSEQPSLAHCYKMIIDPVADLLDQPEIIIVPEGSLNKVPFAAFKGENEKYLSESFKIRIVPSLTTLKLIQDCPADYHSRSGALIIGDPDVGDVIYKGSPRGLPPLPCAREEAKMIGRLLEVQPLVGEHATKETVLRDIHSVSLIHFAAHGDAERGEIALAPLRPFSGTPQEKEYLLTMAEIAQVRLRAKLVVLSCCHSAQGQIKSEGVVGIARAFLGSGARSVLVALWAIEDEATMKFMSRFYQHLVGGESASESLYQTMKWMRSNGFSDVRQWAPFMLIGDNVTIDFRK